MKTSRLNRLVVVAALLALPGFVACGDDDQPTGGNGNPFVGTWTATSFQIQGFDVIVDGVSIDFTFSSGGQYTISIDNDQSNVFCPGTTSCTMDGSYVYTSTAITFDPGTTDEVVFTYSISGDVLTLSGGIEGSAVTATLRKT